MANNTKDLILEKALVMFSNNGYEKTNIREISESLGMTKSVFYKHYTSKEELWNKMLNKLEEYYEEHFGSDNNLPEIPNTFDEFKDLALKLFKFTISDQKVITTRKILLIEQFRDDRVCKLASKHFVEGLESMFTKIFKGMIDKGLIKQGDPSMLAFAFVTPISSLVQISDREPSRKKEILKKMKDFVDYFVSTYCI